MKRIIAITLSAMLTLGAASAAYATGSDSKTVDSAETKATQTAGNASYTDLKTTNWAYEAVNAMNNKGIVKGYPDGSFKPQGVVSQGEFIKMALIAATGEDVGNAAVVGEAGEKQNWAMNYYNKALKLKYFGETDIKSNQLNAQITRGHMALILSNILGETKIDNYAELEESLEDIDSSVENDYDIVKVFGAGIITGYPDGEFKPENTLTRAESATVIYRLTDESKRVLPVEKKVEEPKTEEPKAGTDIGAVIKNYRTFEGISEKEASGSDFMEATSYEFVTDMSAYKVTAGGNGRYKWIDINGKQPLELGWGNMYLVKDKNIVEFSFGGKYTGDITTIEYFVFPDYKGMRYAIGIMPNPLYKNK